MNGTVILVRVALSALVTLVCVGGGVLLLSQRIEVPGVYWWLCVLSIIGVVGKDVVTTVLELRKVSGGDLG
jgi:4-hydroxybenzoate polyprenyltransferase